MVMARTSFQWSLELALSLASQGQERRANL